MDLNSDEYDSEFETKAEELPGSYIIQREIKKAVSGQDFFINDEETLRPVRLRGMSLEVFLYYYKLWENFHYFGLPHGSGWIEERQWLLDFLKIFEKTFNNCNDFVDKKMAKKAQNTG